MDKMMMFVNSNVNNYNNRYSLKGLLHKIYEKN